MVLFGGALPRHFVPGYDHAVPLGTKYILRAEALIKLALIGVYPGWVIYCGAP
jgi:hypothetical protein